MGVVRFLVVVFALAFITALAQYAHERGSSLTFVHCLGFVAALLGVAEGLRVCFEPEPEDP